MIDSIMHVKNHPDGPGYYFFDETWTEMIGPYDSIIEAKTELNKYHLQLDPDYVPEEVDPTDFWVSQFVEAKKGEVVQPLPSEEQIDIAWNKPLSSRPKKRIELKGVDNLYELEGLIDGGYLSFVYGSREGFGSWEKAKFQYSSFLILMDSGESIRRDEYPPYKSRRNERRQHYPKMMETYEQVKILRRQIKKDPLVKTSSMPGYEADDLIAILFLKGIGCDLVIAQDKDFFMVPNLGQAMIDHNGVPQFQRGLKLPKYAMEPNNPGSWVLTQAVFGDKSDTIPRLLPSRTGYRSIYYRNITSAPNLLTAYWNCMAEFGDQFLTNVRLVLLPHPTLSSEDYEIPNLLFEDLANGKYWDPNNFDDHLLELLIEDSKNVDWGEW